VYGTQRLASRNYLGYNVEVDEATQRDNSSSSDASNVSNPGGLLLALIELFGGIGA
jgi:hypothetical protein